MVCESKRRGRESEKEKERGRSKEEHTRAREEERQSGAAGAVVRADGGEEGKREAREGGGMLRSRGNRLPSERAARSRLFLVPAQRPSRLPALALAQRPRRAAPVASPSVVFGRRAARPLALSRVVGTERTSPILLSLSLSRYPSCPRGKGSKDAFSFLPPSLPLVSSPDRLYRLADFSPPPSATARRVAGHQQSLLPVHTHTHTHTHLPRTRQGALFPQKTAPFFERLAAIPRRFHSNPP